MKIPSPFLILVMCFLCFACVSANQDKDAALTIEKENDAPKWISDQGRNSMFPDALFISQLAYGNTAQESKERAIANISEYIKSSVQSSVSSSYFYKETDNSFTKTKELRQDIQVSTDNKLYKVEYTNPYYDVNLGQYACVAFINREQAFNFVKPKLEIARTQFPPAYYTALEKESLLDKIIGVKNAHKILPDFYEVYDFARAILPETAKVYEEVDSLASESLIKIKELTSSVLIKIEGVGDVNLLEKSGIVAELSNQLKKMGFIVGNLLKTNCIALVEVKAVITETATTFETYPEIHIKIIEKGAEKIIYSKKLSKVAGFDRDTVIRRTNLNLTKEITTSFVNECF